LNVYGKIGPENVMGKLRKAGSVVSRVQSQSSAHGWLPADPAVEACPPCTGLFGSEPLPSPTIVIGKKHACFQSEKQAYVNLRRPVGIDRLFRYLRACSASFQDVKHHGSLNLPLKKNTQQHYAPYEITGRFVAEVRAETSDSSLLDVWSQWKGGVTDAKATTFRCGVTVHPAASVRHASSCGVRLYASVNHEEQAYLVKPILAALVAMLFEEDVDRYSGNDIFVLLPSDDGTSSKLVRYGCEKNPPCDADLQAMGLAASLCGDKLEDAPLEKHLADINRSLNVPYTSYAATVLLAHCADLVAPAMAQEEEARFILCISCLYTVNIFGYLFFMEGLYAL
jgi:hypothetical protein